MQSRPDLFSPVHGRYIEPFLGSAAAFFHLAPKRALLSDLNTRLINCYSAVRDYPSAIERHLRAYQKRHSKRFYYRERGREYRSRSAKAAAQLIYLNRVCWNGLYRVNLKGEFNVPLGTKTNVWLEADDFYGTSALLAKVKLSACDFERSIDLARDGDFIFADPPYTTQHNLNGFVKYNENLFQWRDQERLANALKRAKGRGAKFLVSNADHESIVALYKGFSRIERLERPSVIGGRHAKRGTTTELVILG